MGEGLDEIAADASVRRVHAHLLIDDAPSALQEARKAALEKPASKEVAIALIEALAANGLEEEALDQWTTLSRSYPDLIGNRALIENLSWGILHKALGSQQQGVRLGALVGAYLTRDVRALGVLKQMMRDSNAVIRAIAIQMTASYGDAPLKQEIVRLWEEEKVWMVRLQVIKAAGALRMKEMVPQLESLFASEKATYEERGAAVEALVQIADRATLADIERLASSNRAGYRHLACLLADHFAVEGAADTIARLTADSHPAVRTAAFNAFAVRYRFASDLDKQRQVIERGLRDEDPAVAITASWAALLIDRQWGEKELRKWIADPLPENRRLAAAALSAGGEKGVALAKELMRESRDPYVRANLALGLIGQRTDLPTAAETLYRFLNEEKRMWMRDGRKNPLFTPIAPSQVRHNDQMPNYPEAIDQMTRLELVTLLAIVEDPRALEALKTFLQRKTWGITGYAAATLLQEGDETALDLIRSLTTDPEPNVRLQACLVLAMLGKDDSVVKELQSAYARADHEKKLYILEAIGRIGGAESPQFLLSCLQEPFPMLRVAAASALIQAANR
jgi:HEAT repeat protein